MSIQSIIELVRKFSDGDGFDLREANGRIHIADPRFNKLINDFLVSDEGRKSPVLARKLTELQILNRRLAEEDMDDPEPTEDELLEKCHKFLQIFDK